MITKAELLGTGAGKNPEKIRDERERQNAEIERIKSCFVRCLDSDDGRTVLEYLDKYARAGFPDYGNPNKTYAQAGKQELINHIRDIIDMAKKIKKGKE